MKDFSDNAPIQLARLRLLTRDLEAQRRFYTNALGLPLLNESRESFAVQSAGTEIEFVHTSIGAPTYHFAFNIPENQIEEARRWTRARVPLIERGGSEIVFFESWNAHSIYFFDPGGSIVEFIARHTLHNASAQPFGPGSILEVSEIGLAVPDVSAAAKQIERDLGATPYRPISEDFASIGDERGLLIVVRQGRKWFMAEHLSAAAHETAITLAGGATRTCTLERLPYVIRAE